MKKVKLFLMSVPIFLLTTANNALAKNSKIAIIYAAPGGFDNPDTTSIWTYIGKLSVLLIIPILIVIILFLALKKRKK
jgi:uncharacterized membrane protein YidH (DUF202 family)